VTRSRTCRRPLLGLLLLAGCAGGKATDTGATAGDGGLSDGGTPDGGATDGGEGDGGIDDGGATDGGVDSSPDPFDFTAVTAAPRDATVASEPLTLSGFDGSLVATVEGGTLSVDGGPFDTASFTVSAGQSVQLAVHSSPLFATTQTATLTVGDVSGSFAVTTSDRPASSADFTVDLDLDLLHDIGGVSGFDRRTWINVHSSHTDSEWGGDNFTDDLMADFLAGYDVYMGRDTGGITWVLNNVAEDPDRPGYADPDSVSAMAADIAWAYNQLSDEQRSYAAREDLVVGAQVAPFWPDGTLTSPYRRYDAPDPWALSTADTADEPLGTATGEFMGQFVADFYGDDRQPPPVWLEVMNEPLYTLVDVGTEDPIDIFRFHSTVAGVVADYDADLPVGGYTAAFPDFDTDDFAGWTDRWGLFIDTTGADMDFWSLHLYDFPAFGGLQQYRSGSNVEATFDLLDQAGTTELGATPPLVISEYGAQDHDDFGEPWAPEQDWLFLRAQNALLLGFLQRPDLIAKAIPFVPLKAEWGRYSDGAPYWPRLLRQASEGEGESGEYYVYTELVLSYELWEDVAGDRVHVHVSDPDLLAAAYVDGDRLFVVLHNLDDDSRSVELTRFGDGEVTATGAEQRLLAAVDGAPSLTHTTLDSFPDTVALGGGATEILVASFDGPLLVDGAATETRTYAASRLQPITADAELSFALSGLDLPDEGEATLRIGLGRDHGASLQPILTLNGTAVDVPTDWRGGEQADRDRFFGVIEVPVPLSLLASDTELTLRFPDDGGHVSSVALQLIETSRAVQHR